MLIGRDKICLDILLSGLSTPMFSGFQAISINQGFIRILDTRIKMASATAVKRAKSPLDLLSWGYMEWVGENSNEEVTWISDLCTEYHSRWPQKSILFPTPPVMTSLSWRSL